MAAITYPTGRPTAHRAGVAGAWSTVLTLLGAAFVASSTPGLGEAGVLTTATAQARRDPCPWVTGPL